MSLLKTFLLYLLSEEFKKFFQDLEKSTIIRNIREVTAVVKNGVVKVLNMPATEAAVWEKGLNDKATHMVFFRRNKHLCGETKGEFRRFGSILFDVIKAEKVVDEKGSEDLILEVSVLDDKDNANSRLIHSFQLITRSATVLATAIRKILSASTIRVNILVEKEEKEVRIVIPFLVGLLVCGRSENQKIHKILMESLKHFEISNISKKEILELIAIGVTYYAKQEEPADEGTIREVNEVLKEMMNTC